MLCKPHIEQLFHKIAIDVSKVVQLLKNILYGITLFVNSKTTIS